jgi:hypothetical protein
VALPLSYVFNGTEEAAAATQPYFRLFTVPHPNVSQPITEPQLNFASPAAWVPISPTTVQSFSAVCYLVGWRALSVVV